MFALQQLCVLFVVVAAPVALADEKHLFCSTDGKRSAANLAAIEECNKSLEKGEVPCYDQCMFQRLKALDGDNWPLAQPIADALYDADDDKTKTAKQRFVEILQECIDEGKAKKVDDPKADTICGHVSALQACVHKKHKDECD